MRYKPKSGAALIIALGDLPAQMRVKVDPGVAVSAKTVGELRKVTVWPNLRRDGVIGRQLVDS